MKSRASVAKKPGFGAIKLGFFLSSCTLAVFQKNEISLKYTSGSACPYSIQQPGGPSSHPIGFKYSIY